jgi:hypothetical protein
LLAKVASSMAGYYAYRAVAENEPPTSATVDALRRAISVTCGAPESGQYPCTIKARHESGPGSPFPLACAAFADSRDQVTQARCAAAPGYPPPITRTGYVNCATVGKVVSVNDPADDTIVSRIGKTIGKVRAPWADLTGVRVAASPTAFCVDFATVARPRLGTRLILLALNRKASAPDLMSINPTVYFVAPIPEIQLSANTPMSGQFGQSGKWTSWFASTKDIGPTSSGFLRAPFQFRAATEYDEPSSDGLVISDTMPGTPQATIPYP